jgi:hypothetical protein
MAKELLLQVTPEIAANEILLKEYLGKQIKVALRFNKLYFEALH